MSWPIIDRSKAFIPLILSFAVVWAIFEIAPTYFAVGQITPEPRADVGLESPPPDAATEPIENASEAVKTPPPDEMTEVGGTPLANATTETPLATTTTSTSTFSHTEGGSHIFTTITNTTTVTPIQR